MSILATSQETLKAADEHVYRLGALGVPATTRASFYVYNDEADVDALIEALAKAQKFFAV